VLHFPAFLKRLRKWAHEVNVETEYGVEFTDFTYDDKKRINGFKCIKDGVERSVSARLVVDSSGIPSVARRKLPDDCKVENFEIGPKDQFYLHIRYVKLKNPEADRVERATTWPYYKTWVGPEAAEGGAIYGVGANFSYEYAEDCYQNFIKKIKLPEHEVISVQHGSTPFRRPPYSFVTDGFICLGDAACITKPYCGEGISAHWLLCDIAADVAAKALKNGAYPTEAALWETNVRYITTQGAEFAYIMATIVNAVDSTAEENDYEFKHDIAFSEKALTMLSETFSMEMPFKDVAQLVLRMLGGLITGNIGFSATFTMLNGIMVADKLKKLYKKFPATPDGFAAWKEKAAALWDKAGNIADNSLGIK
jgi:flavin-dependent dehydrogenase